MAQLLHIIASPREEESRTLKISKTFLESFRGKPGNRVDEINLFKAALPDLTLNQIDGKFILLGGSELPVELKPCWGEIEKQIGRFLAADLYLVSTPMWNFGIPYVLKHYIDLIVQPRYLFRYTPNGPEGLAKNKKMIIVTSRGGSYEAGTPQAAYDHQEPYLRTVFNFVGITDITFIHAQPMDAGTPTLREEKISQAVMALKNTGWI